MKLIHFPQTRSLRVLWAILELGLEVEVDTRPFDRASLRSPEYLALNPLGKAPVFFDGERRLIESCAIIQYLADVHGGGRLSRRPGDEDYGLFLQWLHFGEGGMGGYVNVLLAHSALLPEAERIPAMREWAAVETNKALNFIEQALGDDGYLLGDFSLADISVGYLLYLLKITRNAAGFGERTGGYFQRLRNRDAWVKATAAAPEAGG